MFHRVKSETTSDTSKGKEEKASSDAVAARPKSASSLSRYSTTKSDTNAAASKNLSQAAQTTQGTVSNKTPAPQKAHSYLQVAKEKTQGTQGTSNQEASNQPKPITNAAPKPSPYSTATKKDTAPMTQTASTKTENSVQSATTQTTGYQRPGGSSYTPSYASPYAQMPARTAQPITENDSKLTIGRGITMSGEIESCNHLFVEGTVEAALKGAEMLDIAETGVFYGSVEIEEASISGRFEGELIVKGRLTIESTGIVTGTISFGEIQIEAGAIIDGRMTPLAQPQTAQQPAPAASSSTMQDDTAEESSEREAVLFEKQETAKEMTAAE